ncbi:dTMP kinase [Sphingomonas sp. BGYR3]|uniref:dTMP kinase n=1 Tax=Sphingomonas sp. BGYR3 TaxID=2975483 RepID=UPI0021A46C09|nr:dTMP kinase [Sphingomonas sp. BGYR3]MDG5487373.1 dTMP kinase [Sphingomonas sp. BGYR3]
MQPGVFISLEGGEGVGKSTQARLLVAAIEAAGRRVLLTREPGGSAGGEAIRALLMQGDVGRWSARAETLLFAAARADHVERVIRPALATGTVVICDRFIDSTRAYQGAQGMDDAAILALHAFGSEGLMPDRTLLLHLAGHTGMARAKARDGGIADRFGARDTDFHRAVAAQFERMAAADPDRFRSIEASGTPEAVHQRVLSAITDLLDRPGELAP